MKGKNGAFNLNDCVYVQLFDEGIEHFTNWRNMYLPSDLQKPKEYFISRLDKDGYIKLQAWEFMRAFGDTLLMGGSPLFNLTIMLDIKDIKPVNDE